MQDFFSQEKPDVVVVAAARVGGILANNTQPAVFMHENLAIAHNCIHEAWKAGVKDLLFLGSSCIYPRVTAQPIKENALLTSPLEPTNEAYAIAKIAGLKLCQYYRASYGVRYYSVMPSNLYGPGDNYHPDHSHVVAGLIRKFHEAKTYNQPTVLLWGTGNPRRELLYVDDLAEGLFYLLQEANPPEWINLGYGTDVTILELAEIIKKIVGYSGSILFDTTKPDGTPRKLLDHSKIRALGWSPKIDLEKGLKLTYEDFIERLNRDELRSF